MPAPPREARSHQVKVGFCFLPVTSDKRAVLANVSFIPWGCVHSLSVDEPTTHIRRVEKKPPISISLQWQCYSDSWANSLEIVTKKCAVWTSAKGKMSRRKKNDNRLTDVILTFLILGCSFFSTNCQQGTFLFFWKYTREKYPFRTANSSVSYFAFRPRGRVTDVIRAILSWIKHRVNANVLADICVVEDLWDSRLSRLNFYCPTTGRPQILRSTIIYCCRVIYERTWKFVQPRHWKIPFDFDNVIRVECVGGIYVIRRVDGVWLSRFTGYGKISLP